MNEPSLETLLSEPKTPPAPLIAASDLSDQIERAFTYHPPKGDQSRRYERIRTAAKDLAHLLNHSCPHSRERALAMTHLESAVLWANAAISRNE